MKGDIETVIFAEREIWNDALNAAANLVRSQDVDPAFKERIACGIENLSKYPTTKE